MEYISDPLDEIIIRYMIKNGINDKEKIEELKQFLFSVFDFSDFFLVDKRNVQGLRDKIRTDILTTEQEKKDSLEIISSLLGGPEFLDDLGNTYRPKFTPALIHKNTRRIYDELTLMGYCGISYFASNAIVAIIEHPYSDGEWRPSFISINLDIYNPEEYEEWVDCEEDEDMFFALCASNLINNERKWMVEEYQTTALGKVVRWKKPSTPPILKYINPDYRSMTTRPATKEEIIEYFKNKK